MIKCILFDLDETLISHHKQLTRFIHDQYSKYLELNRIHYSIWEENFVKYDCNGYRTKDEVYKILIKQFELPGYLYDKLLNDFHLNFHKHVTPFKGSFKLLKNLREIGYKLGIVSNGGSLIQQNKIDQLNLQSYVDLILISEEVCCEKPEPIIFEKALNDLGVEAKETIFVGDNPINDIMGAHNVGMKTILIKNEHYNFAKEKIIPNHTVTSIEELSNYLLND